MMAVTVFKLFPRQKWLGYLAISYARYIGLGVSMTIHWFSDFVAGAFIGTVVGIVVGSVDSGYGGSGGARSRCQLDAAFRGTA